MFNRELDRIKKRNRRYNMEQDKRKRFKIAPRYIASGMYRVSDNEQYVETADLFGLLNGTTFAEVSYVEM